MSAARRAECTSRDLAVGWALHALEPGEEARFVEHLPRCQDCTERVSATEHMAAMLAVGVDQVDPPARLREAVLSAARTPQTRSVTPVTAAAPAAPPVVVPISSARTPRTRRVLVSAAAVVALAFGAGWAGSALLPSSSGSVAGQLADPSVHRTPLTEAGSSTVYGVVLSDSNGASVVPVDMSDPSDGRSLFLWGTGSGAPVLLGKVTPGNGAAALVDTHGRDADGFTGYAVSSEPAGSTPTTPTVLVASSHV